LIRFTFLLSSKTKQNQNIFCYKILVRFRNQIIFFECIRCFYISFVVIVVIFELIQFIMYLKHFICSKLLLMGRRWVFFVFKW
jgi:hypothetical protein